MITLDTLEQDTITHSAELPENYSRTVVVDYGIVQSVMSSIRFNAYGLRDLVLNQCTRHGDNRSHAHLIVDAHYTYDVTPDNAKAVWRKVLQLLAPHKAEIGDIRFEVSLNGNTSVDVSVGNPDGRVIKVFVFTAGYFAHFREDDRYWREIFDDTVYGLNTEDLTCHGGETFDLADSLARGDVSVTTHEGYDGSHGLNDIVLITDRDDKGKPFPRGFEIVREFDAMWDMPDREAD